jgi:Glycosyltransferase family 87
MFYTQETQYKYIFNSFFYFLVLLFIFIYLYFIIEILNNFAFSIDFHTKVSTEDNRKIIGSDFLNLWLYGKAAYTPDPGRFYNQDLYHQKLIEINGAFFGNNWSYPPSLLLFMAPFGLMLFKLALLLWESLSVSLFVIRLRRFMLNPTALMLTCLSPASFITLLCGQTAFLTTVMLISLFITLDSVPVLAGLLIGCLTIKPQVGILIPVMLVASGRWRVTAIACLTCVLIIGLTTTIFGPEVWSQYYEIGLPTQTKIIAQNNPILLSQMQTPYSFFRLLNFDLQKSLVAQGLFTLGAALLTFWAFVYRRKAEPHLLMAHFFACSAVASPYLLSHDLMPLTAALLFLMFQNRLNRFEIWATLLVYFLPVLNIYNINILELPSLSPIVPVIMVLLTFKLYHAQAGGVSVEKTAP